MFTLAFTIKKYLSTGLAITLATALSLPAYAAPITLNDGTFDFSAELRTGSSDLGVIFFHGRGQNPNGDVVRHLGTSLNDRGHTTLSLSNPVPASGLTDFQSYANGEDYIDDLVFARLGAALNNLSSQGINRVVLSGFSLGSRFATASAAAIDQGMIDLSAYGMDLVGLVGVGMYSSLAGSAPTTTSDLNVLDTIGNLALVNSINVLDLYGSNDTQAVVNAGLRRSSFGGNPGLYEQQTIDCPPNDGTYYARNKGVYVPYYKGGKVNRCHQLRGAYTFDGTNYNLDPKYTLRNSPDAPLESIVGDFFARNFETVSVPEPGSLLLMLLGLPLLFKFRLRN